MTGLVNGCVFCCQRLLLTPTFTGNRQTYRFHVCAHATLDGPYSALSNTVEGRADTYQKDRELLSDGFGFPLTLSTVPVELQLIDSTNTYDKISSSTVC